MTNINKEKARIIQNRVLEFEREFEKDDKKTDFEALKRIKEIVEETVDAIEIIETN